MNIEEYEKITQIFQRTVELNLNERSAFLDSACRNDETARRQVEDMLNAYATNPDFLERPAITVIADSFERRLKIGRTIGRYKILREIGRGGMGEVFVAEDTNVNRKVALKVVSSELGENEEWRQRFNLERNAVSKLDHPNIVRIHDFDTKDGISFLVTEYIEGQTLRERLEGGALSLSEALEIIRSVSKGLSFAHQEKVLHRDIKPENIMLSSDRHDGSLTVKILDFGLAKFIEEASETTAPQAETPDAEVETLVRFRTRLGVIMGTPEYMSPERICDQNPDERSDIWSLGVIFYEMLDGRNPFKDNNLERTKAAILDTAPAPLENRSPKLNQIIKKTLEKAPADRYQTVEDFLEDLNNIENADNAGTFEEWLRPVIANNQKPLLWSVSTLLIVSIIGLSFPPPSSDSSLDTFSVPKLIVGIVSLIQAVVIWFALRYFNNDCKPKALLSVENEENGKLSEDNQKATGYETAQEWEAARGNAEIVLKRYMRDWKAILMAWLALYCLLIVKGFPGDLQDLRSDARFYQNFLIIALSVMMTFFNNLSAWKIYLCFNLLNKPTEINQEERTIDDPAYSKGFNWILGFSIVEALVIAGLWMVLWSDLISPYVLTYTLALFNGASGIVGGIVMALYVGRLQNKFIGTATFISIALYSYTAIQPLFLFLETPRWAILLINAALFMKCLLFFYMAWLFKSGRLLYYLVRVKLIYQKIPDDRQNFRKVIKES